MMQQMQATQEVAMRQLQEAQARSRPAFEPVAAPETRSSPPAPVELPQEMDTALRKRTKQFKDTIFKLVKSKRHLDRLVSNVEQLTKGVYPKGLTELKTQPNFIDLDATVPQTLLDANPNFASKIQRDATIREAMTQSQLMAYTFQAECMVAAQEIHISKIQPDAHMSKLEEIVTEVVAEAQQPKLAETFGLSKPLAADISTEVVEARVQSLYKSIFEAVNKKLEVDAEASEKSKAMENEADAAIARVAKPAELLGSLVDTKVEAKVHAALAQAGIIDQGPDAPMPANTDQTPEEAFVSSILPGQAKGISPAEGLGQSPNGKPGGKAYGKKGAKDAPKGTVKDQNAKGPGSGKGKVDTLKGKKGKGKTKSKGKGASSKAQPLSTGRGKGYGHSEIAKGKSGKW